MRVLLTFALDWVAICECDELFAVLLLRTHVRRLGYELFTM